MAKFYDDPFVIEKIISRRRKSLPVSGSTFGSLVFTGRFLYCRASRSAKTEWSLCCECRCLCGSVAFYRLRSLDIGHTRECGCTRAAITSARNKALASLPEPITKIYGILYPRWRSMRERCYDRKNPHFKNYGGRGIYICDEWKDDFKRFLLWSHESGYVNGLTLDRIDNNGPYAPWNCRWTTPKVQARNRRGNRVVTAWGETKCVSEWADDERCAVSQATLRNRIERGIAPEVSITFPRISGSPAVGKRLSDMG